MGLYESKLYLDELNNALNYDIPWEMLDKKSIAISGGTGMIGSFLVDVLLNACDNKNIDMQIYILGRNKEKANKRFYKYVNDERLVFVQCDINKDDVSSVAPDAVDFIIHAASNTHPRAYATDPIGTITANVIGLEKLLVWAKKVSTKRFCFVSSVEIYGENKGDTDKFSEEYLGYIDCNTLRAGYPESKRVGEALCQAYIAQEGLDIVIPRLSRVYGPTMLDTDTKALSQFIKKGVCGEDIILKSEGTQEYSYAYVADAAMALLYTLLCGKCGDAVNIASKDSDIMLKDLAAIIADYAGKKVVFELPDAIESAGYSKATKATLDITKLSNMGFVTKYDIKKGIENTLTILKEIGE